MKVLAVADCGKRADQRGADCMRPRYWCSMIRFPNRRGKNRKSWRALR
ncbi:hypothetical protein [Agrobacterium vitis]